MRLGTGHVYDASAPKQRINMTLNEDLVRVARDYTDNLSDYVEKLLASAIEMERRSKLADQEHWDRVCASWTEFHEKHGCVADDHIGDYLPEDRVP
ncbi:type II toxin-antitoxin system CcdA family antitoxin [Skermanella stibiiresistens]|nr:type II toxin-antitoxin system CcdA family antitoxin [Skermanella stibiiresistens]